MAVPFLHADKDQTLSSYSRNHDNFYQCEVFIHLQANVQETIVLLVTELQDVSLRTLHPTKTPRQLVQVQRKHMCMGSLQAHTSCCLNLAINHQKESGLKVK